MTDPGQELHRPFRWEEPEDTEHLFDARYPRLQPPVIEPGAGWRDKRRARRATRTQRKDAAADLDRRLWKGLPTDAGLGVGLAVVAVFAVATYLLWPSGDDPQPPSGVAAPTATSNPTPGPVGTSPQPTPAGDDWDSPAGRVASRFLLAYNTYSATVPHPVDTWVDGFLTVADPQLVADARDHATDIWGWADKDKMSVLAEEVGDCETVEQSTGELHVWLCDVDRSLWPADEKATATEQTVAMRVEVTDTDDGPLVSATFVGHITDRGEIPAPTAPEGVGE